MNINQLHFVIFTHKGDADLLPITINRIQQVLPEATVHIADDAANPLAAPPENLSGSYRQTHFARRGNLNGMPAVMGILETMQNIMRECDISHLCKIDSDTFLADARFFLMAPQPLEQIDYLAGERSQPFSPAGNCYVVSRHAVRAALEQIHRRRDSWQAAHHYPEDRTIFALIQAARLPHYLIPFPWGIVAGMEDELPADLPPVIKTASVIHAGEPYRDASRCPRPHVLLRLKILEAAFGS